MNGRGTLGNRYLYLSLPMAVWTAAERAWKHQVTDAPLEPFWVS